MFGKKVDSKAAIELIEKTVAECETKWEYGFVLGMLEMAKKLGAITQNEAADYNSKAARQYQEIEQQERQKRIEEAKQKKLNK